MKSIFKRLLVLILAITLFISPIHKYELGYADYTESDGEDYDYDDQYE